MLVTQSCSTLFDPWTIATRLLCPWNSPGKNTGVGCHSLLQGIFPTQGSNTELPHFRWILYIWATGEGSLIYATAWNVKDIILSETSYSQNTSAIWFPLVVGLGVVKIVTETESVMVVTWGCGEGKSGNYCLVGTEFQFYKMKKVLKMDGGNDCAMCLTSLNCILETL